MSLESKFKHLPVLLEESVKSLLSAHGPVYVDCTFGGGGHTLSILQRKSDSKVIAFDLDKESFERSSEKFTDYIKSGRIHFVHANYSQLREKLLELGYQKVDGVLLDAGVSSFQLDQPWRGFSFSHDGPLDMRMDQSRGITAKEVVNEWPREQLEKILFRYGEEKFSRKIVSKIIEARSNKILETTLELAKLIENCLPSTKFKEGRRIHPATKTFQAIRIAVNDELSHLEKVLQEIPAILNPGGVFAAISFHSLEDRLVKERLKFLTANCVCPLSVITCDRCGKPEGYLLQKKPIIATDKEQQVNPRSRSAKLRVFLRK
ncbi:MAG: 16S rRNA (cytosine(1402)-N(4))-methyltransferase RsmH [Oligoflexia bacterium]|nr:16S rRNA (cytosine(1402)-N(4))-methyltransferase RsmH [Oligoflexia bacterium]